MATAGSEVGEPERLTGLQDEDAPSMTSKQRIRVDWDDSKVPQPYSRRPAALAVALFGSERGEL